MAFKLGRLGPMFGKEAEHTPRIVIGKDTRKSGDMLENALVAGICSAGAEAVCLGIISTPAVAYLTREYGADAGVVISASHNPAEFNGIKFFSSKGYKLSDEIEERIEAIILDNEEIMPSPSGGGIGSVTEKYEAADDYISFLKKTVNCTFKGLKIALDCANGAAYRTAPKIFRDLEAEVLVINDSPDGEQIRMWFYPFEYAEIL